MAWMGTCGGVGHVVGCGGMWQGLWRCVCGGTCGKVEVCGRGQAYGIDGDM